MFLAQTNFGGNETYTLSLNTFEIETRSGTGFENDEDLVYELLEDICLGSS